MLQNYFNSTLMNHCELVEIVQCNGTTCIDVGFEDAQMLTVNVEGLPHRAVLSRVCICIC